MKYIYDSLIEQIHAAKRSAPPWRPLTRVDVSQSEMTQILGELRTYNILPLPENLTIHGVSVVVKE